jgi:hypothetical protein
VLLVSEGFAQQAVAPASRQALREQIVQAPAVELDPRIVNRAVIPADNLTVGRDDVAPAATQPEATVRPETAADEPAVEEHTAAVPRLDRGQLLFVELEGPSEQTARRLLVQQVAATSQVDTSSLQAFKGAVRQLAQDEQEVQLKSYVLVGQPLRYVLATKQFEGSIVVGAVDLFGEGRSRVFTVPLLFEVLETALADPSKVELRETSPPFERIKVTSSVIGQPATLRIASNFSREGVVVEVPVEPTLLVSIVGGDLRAYGMQSTSVKVIAVGGVDGAPGGVTLNAPGAILMDDEELTFNEHGMAEATLRTDRPGGVTVTAQAKGYVAGSDTVSVIRPWPTLLATCFGGFVGGFVRLGTRIGKGTSVTQFAVGMIISVFVGIMVFALQVVGVRLLPVTFSVEVGDIFAFAVAALAGWLGTGVLPQATGPAPKAD